MSALTKQQLVEGLAAVRAAQDFMDSHSKQLLEIATGCLTHIHEKVEQLLGCKLLSKADHHLLRDFNELSFSMHLRPTLSTDCGVLVATWDDRDGDVRWSVVITEDLLTDCEAVAYGIARQLYGNYCLRVKQFREERIREVQSLREKANIMEKALLEGAP